MAAQEKYVHLPKPLPAAMEYVSFVIDFGTARVARIPLSSLPADWDSEPVAPSTQRIGDSWVTRGRTAILAVPSALIPSETNYILNPKHRDFAKIRISKPQRFAFAPRVARLLDPAALGGTLSPQPRR